MQEGTSEVQEGKNGPSLVTEVMDSSHRRHTADARMLHLTTPLLALPLLLGCVFQYYREPLNLSLYSLE